MSIKKETEPVSLGSTAKGSFKVFKAFDQVSLVGSQIVYSNSIDITNLRGYFGAQWAITGTGSIKIEVLSSINGLDFLDVNSDVATNQTSTSGPGGNGKNAVSFTLIPCSLFKFKLTELSGLATIMINLWVKGY